MDNWTPEHWDNLRLTAKQLVELLGSRDVDNRAWRLKLAILLGTIADYNAAITVKN